MTEFGVVAIGRNEGERLRGCLSTLALFDLPVVYVDSGSTDGSVALALTMGAAVVELDTSIPFTAARARNAGFQLLLESKPLTKFVQFVDSDCEISKGWFEVAIPYLERTPKVAVVCGRRRERFPERSLYNRLIDIEWDTPFGEILSCGGDALMKVEAFAAVGRFDESIVAGEEPEFCSRLLAAGFSLLRIDAEMTLHDAAIVRFSQWWLRHQRSGYGGLDVQKRFQVKLFDRELSSARLWTIGLLVLLLAMSVVGGIWFGMFGSMVGILIGGLLWCLQSLRLSLYYRRKGLSWTSSIRAGAVSMVVKWANLMGQLRYYRDRRRGRFSRLIEYKSEKSQRSTRTTIPGEALSP